MNSTDESLKTITKGAGIVFIGIFISKLLTYAYRVIVARIGTEQYGLISLGIAVVGIFVTISLFGMNEGVLRYVSYYKGKEDKAKIKGIILTTFKITTALSLVTAILLFVFAEWISITIFHNPQLTPILKLFAIIIPFNVIREIFLSIARAFKKVEYEVYSKNIIENITKVLLTLILLYFGFNVMGAAIAYFFAILFSTIAAFYFFKKIYILFKTKLPPLCPNKELFSYCWPLIFNTFIFQIILWTDTFMIGYFKSTSDVGIYNAALPTAQMMYIFPYALMTLFFPVLTELYAKESKQAFKSIYKTTTKWIFMVNAILLSFFILFSKEILQFLFGKEYVIASPILIILSCGYFFYYLMTNSNYVLMTLKKTKLIFTNTVIGASFNLVLNFILIPIYGILGAAIATITSLIVIAILRFSESYYITRINPFKIDFLKRIFSIIIATFVTKYLINLIHPLNEIYVLLLGILSFLPFYLLLLFLTQSFKKNDIMIMKSIYQKLTGYFER